MAQAKSAARKPRKPRERRRDKEVRPQQIVAAAFEEFAEKGFAGTRLEDVASRAKVSKGLPYLYFKTKVELFKAVIRSVITSHFEVIRKEMEATHLSVEDFLKGPFLAFIQDLVSSRRAFIARLLIAEGHKHPELTEFYYDVVIARGMETLTEAHRSRHRERRVSRHALARLSAAPHRAGAHGHHLAVAVRALSSPRYRRAACHQYRAAGRGREGAAWPQCRRGRPMKRLVAFLVFVVIAGVAALLLTTFPANRETIFPGYMEADLVLVGSEQGGRIETLSVLEGDSVEKAAPIFTLESTEQEAEVAAARARVTEAEARLADAKQQMQRPSEIDVLEASLSQAKAMLVQSNLNLDRTRTLFDKNWVSKAQLDEATAQHDRNEAAVAEAERRITAAKLPNRSDLIDAAAAAVETARHSLEQAEKGLAKRKVFAPAPGTVEEVYFRPGEVVNSGQAVVALLPPGNLKVRFFVAEPVRASLHTGQVVKVTCDGCRAELTAKISFIAREAEFTPPVIFSQEQRQKLVFLVEARPSGEAARLTAGQPVTVSLGPAPQLVQR